MNKKTILLGTALIALGILPVLAQEIAPPKEGELNKYISRDPKDVMTALNLLTQNIYEEEVDTSLVLFLLQYGNHVHVRRFFYPAADREMVPAYIFTPASLQQNVRAPGLLIVHGGFHEKLDWRYFHLIDLAVSKGYVVMFPEYRGSSGYGEQNFKNDYGVTDVADVLSAGDYLKTQNDVDPARIGILGHSRGGMTTLLAIERDPKRFQVAVDIAGLADFLAYMSYKPDDRRMEVAKEPHFKGQLPIDNLAAYMDITPLNYVDKIQTPLLVLATTGDKIVPYALNSGRLIELLKAHGKVFDSHTYTNAPGGHVFLFGDSEEARDCFERAFDWLGKYLKP